MSKIRGFKIKLRKRETLRNLKWTSKVKPLDTKIEDAIQKQIENGYSLIYPSAIYNTYHSNSKVKEIFLCSKKVTGLLDKSSAFTLLAVTIGKKLEEEVNKLKKSDLTSAFILDSVGSEAAEQCANFVSSIIKEEASKDDCRLSMRISPGYGDLPMDVSGKILDLLEGKKIGVSIKSSGILIPRKSITGVQVWLKK